MQSRSIRRSGDQDNPHVPAHCRMRLFDRDLIRGGHYGQRSCEPHQKAEHMAAPTNAAKRELQKSKIERQQKSRESRFLDASTAATLCSADAKVRGRFCKEQ